MAYPPGVTDNDPYFDMPSVNDEADDEPMRIPCGLCGKLTTWDPIYQNLCYRCIRADNE